MAHVMTQRHTGIRRTEEHDTMNAHALMDEGLQYRAYGGFYFGSALFGWLVSTGLATILVTLIAAAGAAIALTNTTSASALTAQAGTIGMTGGILLVLALALAYYAGGYVAGRMARFDGARQGFGVWLIGVIITLILGAIGAGVGAKYNLMQQLNLPHLPISQAGFTRGGLITTLAVLVVTLLTALLGGKVGERFHRKVDAAGTVATATD